MLLLLILACDSQELVFGGNAVAVGGRADFYGEHGDGACVLGDCTSRSVITEARVKNEDIARVVAGDLEEHAIEGLEVGTARLVADLTFDGWTARRRLEIPVVEAAGLMAYRDGVLVEAPLEVAPGEELVLTTSLVDADGAHITGEGLHALFHDGGLLTLDEDGGAEHVIVAGSTPGTALVGADLTGETLLEIVITAP